MTPREEFMRYWDLAMRTIDDIQQLSAIVCAADPSVQNAEAENVNTAIREHAQLTQQACARMSALARQHAELAALMPAVAKSLKDRSNSVLDIYSHALGMGGCSTKH